MLSAEQEEVVVRAAVRATEARLPRIDDARNNGSVVDRPAQTAD
jgi:hypothetical protein